MRVIQVCGFDGVVMRSKCWSTIDTVVRKGNGENMKEIIEGHSINVNLSSITITRLLNTTEPEHLNRNLKKRHPASLPHAIRQDAFHHHPGPCRLRHCKS